MSKEIKYKNYRIGPFLFTVEMIKGADMFGDYVDITVRKRHDFPRNFFERVKIKFKKKYIIGDSIWRPTLNNKSLEQFILDRLDFITDSLFKIKDFETMLENLD